MADQVTPFTMCGFSVTYVGSSKRTKPNRCTGQYAIATAPTRPSDAHSAASGKANVRSLGAASVWRVRCAARRFLRAWLIRALEPNDRVRVERRRDPDPFATRLVNVRSL